MASGALRLDRRRGSGRAGSRTTPATPPGRSAGRPARRGWWRRPRACTPATAASRSRSKLRRTTAAATALSRAVADSASKRCCTASASVSGTYDGSADRCPCAAAFTSSSTCSGTPPDRWCTSSTRRRDVRRPGSSSRTIRSVCSRSSRRQPDLLGQPLEQQPGPPGPDRERPGGARRCAACRPRSSGREGSRRARCATISRLSSSHQCRSSSASSAGPSLGQRGQPLDRVQDEQPAPPVRVARVGGRCSVTSTRSVTQRRARGPATSGTVRPRHRVPEVQQQAGRQLDVLGEGAGGPQREALGRGQLLQRAQQPGLADAGLAGQQQQLAACPRAPRSADARRGRGARPCRASPGCARRPPLPSVSPTSVPGTRPPCRAFDR